MIRITARDFLREYLQTYWRECGRYEYKEERWNNDRSTTKSKLKQLIKKENYDD